MENEITEASKILATYLGWIYVPSNNLGDYTKAGWYKMPKTAYSAWATKYGSNYVCRGHNDLRFYNSYDALFEVIDKLEKEDLSRYMYSWTDDEDETKLQYNFNGVDVWVDSERVCVRINQQLDPGIKISGEEDKELPKKQRLFWALVESVKYINELKNNV